MQKTAQKHIVEVEAVKGKIRKLYFKEEYLDPSTGKIAGPVHAENKDGALIQLFRPVKNTTKRMWYWNHEAQSLADALGVELIRS